MFLDSMGFPFLVHLNSRGCDPFETEHITDVNDPILELIGKVNGTTTGASD